MKKNGKKRPVIVTAGLNPGEWEEDDCAICRLMAQAEREGREPSLEEVLESFREAEKEGAVVGWPEETDD